MSQPQNNQDQDLEKIDQDINFHRIIIFLIILSVIAFYLIMKEITVTEAAQHWGPVGDFFGGILNPIFALFAFYWLTYSVRLQIKELKETRQELKKAAQAQEESAKHQETIAILEARNVETQGKILDLNKDTLESQQFAAIAQQEQIAIQNFESLFFQLLKTKTDVTNDILVGSKGTLVRYCELDYEVISKEENKVEKLEKNKEKASIKKIDQMIKDRVQGKESIKDHLILFKSYVKDNWENFYTDSFLDIAGSYFRLNYQIVKLIDQNETLQKLEKDEDKDYTKKQKEYFDLFRATFTQYELEAFFFNCLYKYGNDKFKKMLEKYGMFEPLLIDLGRGGEKSHPLTRYAYKYNRKIFEKNDLWNDYFKLIDCLKNIDSEKVKKTFITLYRVGFINIQFYHKKKYNFDADPLPEAIIDSFYGESFLLTKGFNSFNWKQKISANIKLYEDFIIRNRKKVEGLNNNEINGFNFIFNNEGVVQTEILSINAEIKNYEYCIEALKEIDDLDFIFIFVDYGIRIKEFVDFLKLSEK